MIIIVLAFLCPFHCIYYLSYCKFNHYTFTFATIQIVISCLTKCQIHLLIFVCLILVSYNKILKLKIYRGDSDGIDKLTGVIWKNKENN